MAQPTTPKFTGVISNQWQNEQAIKEKLVNERVATLDPKHYATFSSILNKYPNLSKDAAMAAVANNFDATTNGLDKIVTADGLNQLILDRNNLAKIKSISGDNKNFASSLKDMAYGALKGVSRYTFAALQAPYQYVTTIGRDLYAQAHGEKNVPWKADLGSQIFGTTTNLGQIAQGYMNGDVRTGNGFFVDPTSKVGKAQADAMGAYGRVNGKSFTLGRSAANGMGADPNSTFYKVTSGAIDAILNVALDPSTWVGPGSVSKIIKGGKELAEAKTAADAIVNAKANLIKDTKKVTTAKAEIRRDLRNNVKIAEQKVLESQSDLTLTTEKRTTRIYNAITKASKSYVGSPEAAKILGDENMAKAIVDLTEKSTQAQVIDHLGQLSADHFNTGEAFAGHIITDALPESGKVGLGVMGHNEFVITKSGKKTIKTLDIASNEMPGTAKEVAAEAGRRADFIKSLENAASDKTISRSASEALKNVHGVSQSLVDSFMFNTGDTTLSTVIKAAVDSNNPAAVEYVMDSIRNIWKADAIENIRSVHGGIGGYALLNDSLVAGRRVNLSRILDKTMRAETAKSTIDNLAPSLAETKDSIARAKQELDDAKNAHLETNRRIREVDAMYKNIESDPDLRHRIMNEENYQDVRHLVNLKDKVVSGEDKVREFLNYESGVVPYMGGPLSANRDKALDFLLGKRFAHVIQIIANEKDPTRIYRLFGRKIDYEMAQEIAKAENAVQVETIFLRHLASPVTDPSIYRSMSLRMQTANLGETPLIKLAPKIPEKVIEMAEKTENYFGRYFSRSVVLPLENMDRLVRGLEDWGTSAGIDIKVIDGVITKVANAATPQERSGIIRNALSEMSQQIAIKAKSPELASEIERLFKVGGKDNILNNAYMVPRQATDSVPSIALHKGGKQQMMGAFYEHQLLDDVVKLPDSRDLKQMINKYQKNKLVYGTGKAKDAFAQEFGDRWRTAQLAFRASYILRNVGEMQFRQFFSGHDTLFNHPMGYLAMIAANPTGNGFQKFASKIAKYDNDVFGKSFKGEDLNGPLSEAVNEHYSMLNRAMSAHDPRMIFTGKMYKQVTPADKDFYKALAQTMSRFHNDDIIPRVAKCVTEKDRNVLLKEIIDESGTDGSFIYNMVYGGRGNTEITEFGNLLLKDTTGKVTPKNINTENLRSYLFGLKGRDGDSIESSIGTVTGGNELLRKLIANGNVESVYGKNSALEVIGIPKFEIKNKAGKLEGKSFDSQINLLGRTLEKHFSKEQLSESRVIGSSDFARIQNNGMLNAGVDWFFKVSSKFENIINFGPEFRMAYWDHVGRYAQMLSTEDLQKLVPEMKKSLQPLKIKGKPIGRNHPAIRVVNDELKKRSRSADADGMGMSLGTLNSMASDKASEYVKNLFYDAAKTRQVANSMRILFPFAQAQFNTLFKWAELAKDNPVKFIRVGKAYNALTQPGTSAIYDMTGVKHDENQGFFYKNDQGDLTFRYPIAGTVLGAMAGTMVGQGVDASSATQLTAPVQSLNLGFGVVNPMMPGVGPTLGGIYQASGLVNNLSTLNNAVRNVIFPFGPPKDLQSWVLPSWLRKTALDWHMDQSKVQRNAKDWASYLASTGNYGDNPLADQSARNRLFDDAGTMSRWALGLQGLFQNILPATPSQEVFLHDKNGDLRTQTVVYKAWEDIQKNHTGDYFGAAREFADTFGWKNLLVMMGGSTRAVQGTGDAWSFLGKHPEAADKYARINEDIVPYFFPGGEAATAYYQWQKATGRRTQMNEQQLNLASENFVYQMAMSQISEEQAAYGYDAKWLQTKTLELNKQFGGKPSAIQVIGAAPARIETVNNALKDPIFQESPIYQETKTYMEARQARLDYMRELGTAVSPSFTANNYISSRSRDELLTLAKDLMAKNPAFSVMFSRVFLSELKVKG